MTENSTGQMLRRTVRNSCSSHVQEFPIFKDMSVAVSQTIYFRWPEVDRFYEQRRDHVEVIQAPTDKFYGMRAWYMRDCNGYRRWFGQLIDLSD